jgi:hypothetical protein
LTHISPGPEHKISAHVAEPPPLPPCPPPPEDEEDEDEVVCVPLGSVQPMPTVIAMAKKSIRWVMFLEHVT